MAKSRGGEREVPVAGVAFPLVDGRRSTTATGRAVFAAAARGVDPALAAGIEAESSWHERYPVHLRRLVQAGAASPEAAERIAADGLAAAYDRFVLTPGQGAPAGIAGERSLNQGLGAAGRKLETVEVVGGGRRQRRLELPHDGRRLRRGKLLEQLEQWVAQGVIEPSAAAAVEWVLRTPGALDLRDLQVALLGAGAEMGPLRRLLSWGATVYAVDVPRAAAWVHILGGTQGSAGRLMVPVESERWVAGTAEAALIPVAGVDVIRDAASVRDWLAQVDGSLTVGTYGYADGADHVRLAMAMDAVVGELRAGGAELSLAMLATPTDVYVAPPAAVAQARARYAAAGALATTRRRLVRAASRGRVFTPSYSDSITTPDGRAVDIVDCLVPTQGANYALAKHLQRWRATAARSGGVTVSANVAPPTRTASVLRSRALARAYAGSRRFGIETLSARTSRSLMVILLVHDLRNPGALANPANPLPHPDDLFADGAVHGGLWRVAYEPRSILGPAMLVGAVSRRA